MAPRVVVIGTFASLLLFAAPWQAPGDKGPGFRFEELRVLSAGFDRAEAATRVSVRFRLVDETGAPAPGLSHTSFQALEDGVPATSEALARANDSRDRVDVVVLLDTSKSMYDRARNVDPNAPRETAVGDVRDMKRAARAFVERLGERGPQNCRLHYYRFANRIASIGSIDEIPDFYGAGDGTGDGKKGAGGGRWTALYHALFEVIARHDRPLVVLFSDGADNYSQNYGIEDVRQLERILKAARITVHAIGFGDVDTELDRRGVAGGEALRRIARNGTLRLARDPAGLGKAFKDIADRVLCTYTYDYYSPNLEGRHDLQLRARRGERVGTSTVISFVAGDGAPGREAAGRSGRSGRGGRGADAAPRWEQLGPELVLPLFDIRPETKLEELVRRFGQPTFRWEEDDLSFNFTGVCMYFDRLGLVFRFWSFQREGFLLKGVREWSATGAPK